MEPVNGSLPDRRSSAADLHNIAQTTQGLSTRVAVLETRIDHQAAHLAHIDQTLTEMNRDVKAFIQHIGVHAESLKDHMVEEHRDRTKVLAWIVSTMVSVMLGVLALIANHFLG